METLKKFFIYFLIFIALYLIIEFLIFAAMKDNYRDITNYEIKSETSEIVVTESKAARSHGYIKGSVTNNEESIIPLKYLQVKLYDEDGIYLGSEYKELKNFYPKETINFDINYRYNNVNRISLDLVDEIPEKAKYPLLGEIEDDKLNVALPIAGLLMLYVIIP